MKFKLSATQLIVFSLILFFATNIFIWYAISRRISVNSKNLIELQHERANNRLEQAEGQLRALYKTSKNHVLVMANLIELDIVSELPKAITAQRLAQFLDINREYLQARLIDASGKEVIRTERTGDSVLIFEPEALQYKGDRYYFKEALQLPKGDVYVSQMDLNEEEGKVETPYRPTVRFFSPVYEKGKKIGIIGLNLNVENWFQVFESRPIGVLNSQNEVFLDTESSLYQKFEPDLVHKDEHGHPDYFSKKISLEGDQQWTLFTRPNNTALDAKLQKFKNSAYKTGGALSAGVLFLLLVVHMLHLKNRNISKLNQAVENRLNERDTLIKEIHHRVKNNLQVVASLLSLQSSFIKDEQIKMLFRYSQYRINSMGIVHEMLYKSNDLNRIDYGEYIKQLVAALIVSMKGDKGNINLVTDVEKVFLNVDTSIPLGLMINEIITNSLKYGFSDTEEGTITVEMAQVSTFTYKLTIGDNGSGIPSKINFRNTKSLGLKLIHKLALQLRGNIEKDNSKKGTNYIVTFQEIEQTS